MNHHLQINYHTFAVEKKYLILIGLNKNTTYRLKYEIFL